MPKPEKGSGGDAGGSGGASGACGTASATNSGVEGGSGIDKEFLRPKILSPDGAGVVYALESKSPGLGVATTGFEVQSSAHCAAAAGAARAVPALVGKSLRPFDPFACFLNPQEAAEDVQRVSDCR
eukprot:GHVU01007879.1.p3 GENE.GHVU01007879.1~~GHVU01007879.1.p3  ORF type:complete len:126 (+),score=21.02 GHVU01007879.1:165-542(+)